MTGRRELVRKKGVFRRQDERKIEVEEGKEER